MKRTVSILIVLSLVSVIVIVGAFVAVRLISGQEPLTGLPRGAQVFEDVTVDGSGNEVTVRTVILPASELPDEPSAAAGVLVRQEDNSYFVGTGSVSVDINIVDGDESVAVDHSGPEIEVVTGRDTQFYQDVTEVSFTAAESKEQTLQQEVIPVEQPETMPGGASFQAWGERRGDRVVADVVVFSEQR